MIKLKGNFNEAIIQANDIGTDMLPEILSLCNNPILIDSKIRIMPDTKEHPIGIAIELTRKNIPPSIIGSNIGCGTLTTIFTTNEKINLKELKKFITNEILIKRSEIHPSVDKKVIKAIEKIVKELKLNNVEDYLNNLISPNNIQIGEIGDNVYVLSVFAGASEIGYEIYDYFQTIATTVKNNNIKENTKTITSMLKTNGRTEEISRASQLIKKTITDQSINLPNVQAYISDKDIDNYLQNIERCMLIAAENRRIISEDILKFLNANVREYFDTPFNYIEQVTDGKGGIKYVVRAHTIKTESAQTVSIPINQKEGIIIARGKGNSDWNNSAPYNAENIIKEINETVDIMNIVKPIFYYKN